MQHIHMITLVIILFLALALIVFIVIRNRKDRQKLFRDDPVEREIDDQQRRKDKY